jgi:NDP-sugar pyrophosphorylase family protein
MTKIVILCGGRGTRLKPYTISIPKPLVPFQNKPILIDILQKIKKNIKANQFTISTGYLSSLIISYLESEKKSLKLNFNYLEEKIPLGTAGSLSLIRGNDDVLLVNGDTLTDLSYKRFIKTFEKDKPGILIASHEKNYIIDFGILKSDNKNNLIEYNEKPKISHRMSMGIYLIRNDVIKLVPKNKRFDIPNLINKCLSKNIEVKLYSHKGYWYDLGRPEDFDKANSL